MLFQKDYYLISLIEEILIQYKDVKYFTKIDKCQTFYQIGIFEDLDEFTTFLTRFSIFKYLIILFNLFNKPVF